MQIFKYILKHKLALLVIIALLSVQAFTDLSLPRYTSDIVDVGIQQSGVDHASTTEVSAETFELVSMIMSEQDEAYFASCYDQQANGNYQLNDKGQDNREELDGVISFPLMVVYYANQMDNFDIAQVKQAYDAGMVTKDQIGEGIDEARKQMGDMSDAIIEQQAVAAAQEEYKALGYDLDQMQIDYLVGIAIKMAMLAGLGMIMAILVGLIASRTGARIGANLRERLFSQVVGFSSAEVEKFSAASLITRCTNDIQLIQMVSILLMRMVLFAPILSIGGIIMVSRTSLSMGWIIMVAVVAVLVLVGVLMVIALPKFKIMQTLIDRVNLVSRESLTGLQVIRAFGRQDYEYQRFDVANLNLMNTQLFTNRVMSFMGPCMMLIMNAVAVAIVWFGGHYIDNGTLQTGDMIAFITYSMVVVSGFLILSMVAIFLPRASVAADRIQEVLTTDFSIADPKPAAGKAGEGSGAVAAQAAGEGFSMAGSTQVAPALAAADAAGEGGARIAFDNVSFKYGDSEEYVLKDIDFVAEPGQMTAIIGSTGSGKSTLAKLIERFYDVTEGAVTLDGRDIRTMTQHDLRANVGYVPQQAFLFTGTVASNIAYSDDFMPDERINQAIRIAQASEFVESREEGLDAAISQGGTNVSGGQRQRLAIARALATNARAYLFDDSFSALDYKTDAALRRDLRAQLSDKTVIVIAQRIATVMNADKIIVLEEGRIVGQGTHGELLATCPEYKEIAASQLSEAELEGGERS